MLGCTGGKETPEVTFERGRMLADRGNFEDAIPLFDTALDGTPDSALIYYERGRAYENLGADKKELLTRAIEDYTTCLEKDPDFLQAMNNKGVVLARLSKYQEAAEEFSRLIAADPEDVLALRNRGLCFHDRGEFEKALADYETALGVAADDTETLFQRGNVFLEQKEYQAAIVDYDKAIEFDPEYAKAWMNRGVAKYGLNQRQAALQDLKHAQVLDDNIILPGIDWLTAGTESTDAANMTASRPVYLESADGDNWTEFLSVVQKSLTDNGLKKIKLLTSVPQLQCGRFEAQSDEKPIVIYFGLLNPETSDVSLPAGSHDTDEPNRALLVMKRSTPDAEFAVERFIKTWNPVPADVAPRVISVQISEK